MKKYHYCGNFYWSKFFKKTFPKKFNIVNIDCLSDAFDKFVNKNLNG